MQVYLDHHATTAVDERVLARMLPYFREHFGNAASRSHVFGWRAEEAVDAARAHVANLIGATAQEIVFTSGATESNNLALLGVGDQFGNNNCHVITQATEHKAILDCCKVLQKRGVEVTILPVDKAGRVDAAQVQAALKPNTRLVSIMAVNNEIGTVQPLAEIGQICRKAGVWFHVDAAQAAGIIDLHVDKLCIDMLSLSGHKMYAPKGIGALYVRRRNPRVTLSAQMHGGGHERGMRSGTLNVPGIVGLGEASRLAKAELPERIAHLLDLRTRLFERLNAELDSVVVNGSMDNRHPGNLNLAFARVEGEALILALREVAVSSGAACASATLEPSHVLAAIGVPSELAHSSVRFGMGRENTREEIDFVAELVIGKVRKLRHNKR